jgi:hypothetical protein
VRFDDGMAPIDRGGDMIIVKSGVVEIESKDPTMRSFLVPHNGANCRVNVWRTKNGYFTVGTYLNHPKKGQTQLFRKNLNEMEVRELLKNPRKHTGKGYSRKAKK